MPLSHHIPCHICRRRILFLVTSINVSVSHPIPCHIHQYANVTLLIYRPYFKYASFPFLIIAEFPHTLLVVMCTVFVFIYQKPQPSFSSKDENAKSHHTHGKINLADESHTLHQLHVFTNDTRSKHIVSYLHSPSANTTKCILWRFRQKHLGQIL